jgi:PAS domain S-box-containing protein
MATYRAGRRFVVHDTRSDPLFAPPQRQAPAAVQVLGAVGVPLLKQGALVAILAVHSAAPRHWTEEEVALVEETAERTWAAVERARAQAAQRQSERRLAAVFESLPLGVGLVDTQGSLLLANPEMRRFMPDGVIPSCDEARYERWRAYHPDGRRIERRDYPGARALRGEWVLPGVEFLFLYDDGRETWIRVAAMPIRDGEGRITGAVGVAADIDAAKRAEQALRESERRAALL